MNNWLPMTPDAAQVQVCGIRGNSSHDPVVSLNAWNKLRSSMPEVIDQPPATYKSPRCHSMHPECCCGMFGKRFHRRDETSTAKRAEGPGSFLHTKNSRVPPSVVPLLECIPWPGILAKMQPLCAVTISRTPSPVTLTVTTARSAKPYFSRSAGKREPVMTPRKAWQSDAATQ